MERADEIKLPWGQRHRLKEFADRYPDKTLILQHIFPNKNFDKYEIYDYLNEIDNTLILCVGNAQDCFVAADNNIPFYYAFPAHNYQEFKGIQMLDPEYIIPGAPLFFDMPFLAESGVPIRVFPTIGNFSAFPQTESAHGTWIRPEDMDFYSQFVAAYEFMNVTVSAERALFRIYHDDKHLYGPLGLIIDSVKWDYAAHSDLILDELVSYRIRCKQKCESKESNCHLCESTLHLANPKRLEYLLKARNEK